MITQSKLLQIFINDLPEYLKDANDKIILNDEKVSVEYANSFILTKHLNKPYNNFKKVHYFFSPTEKLQNGKYEIYF